MRFLSLLILTMASSNEGFSGGSGGGFPPAKENQILNVTQEEFREIAIDAINNPDFSFIIKGKPAFPTLIDLKAKTIRLENESTIIDINQFLRIDSEISK